MTDLPTTSLRGKISPGMSARLARVSPGKKMRAVLLLRVQEPISPFAGRRHTPEERQSAVNDIRNSVASAVRNIDAILIRYEGRRLSESSSALGAIAVESTPAGIKALSESKDVRAIIEDQPISRVS